MPIATLVIPLLVKYGPDIAQAVQRMLTSGKDPTPAEWDALFAKARTPYDQFIRDAETRANS